MPRGWVWSHTGVHLLCTSSYGSVFVTLDVHSSSPPLLLYNISMHTHTHTHTHTGATSQTARRATETAAETTTAQWGRASEDEGGGQWARAESKGGHRGQETGREGATQGRTAETKRGCESIAVVTCASIVALFDTMEPDCSCPLSPVDHPATDRHDPPEWHHESVWDGDILLSCADSHFDLSCANWKLLGVDCVILYFHLAQWVPTRFSHQLIVLISWACNWIILWFAWCLFFGIGSPGTCAWKRTHACHAVTIAWICLEWL